MNRLTRVVMLAASAVLVLDTVGAIASARLGFSYTSLSPISIFIYAAAGFAASRIAGLRAAVIVGSAVAFIEATLGWFISWQIGPGRPPEEYGGAGAILLAITLVTAMGALVGLLGGTVARWRRFQNATGLAATDATANRSNGLDNPNVAAFGTFFARFRAIGLDVLVLVSMLMVIVVAGDLFHITWAGRLAVAIMLLYEPLQTWRYGGTVGHRWANLRIVAERTGGNPGLATAFVRFVAKVVLGLPSFVFMAVTRRHQALHDRLARTTVRIRNLDRVAVGDVAWERSDADVAPPDMPSKLRRILLITTYSVVSFVVMSIVALATVSELCVMEDVCTPGDDRRLEIGGLTWFALTALWMVLGWRGRLWGARRTTAPASTT